MPEVPDLVESVRELIRRIPRGAVATFGDIAIQLGDPAAARWVGNFVNHHEHDDDCMCHRVVRVTGEVGGFAGGSFQLKECLLEDDRVPFRDGRIELHRCRFDFGEPEAAPLATLSDWQSELENIFSGQTGAVSSDTAKRSGSTRHQSAVASSSRVEDARQIMGVDISYGTAGNAVACCVLYDRVAMRMIDSATCSQKAPFPYISGYLAFREAPAMIRAVHSLCRRHGKPDLLLVDGNGRLHPRRSGVACIVGMVLQCSTVGVGKSLLCGRRRKQAGPWSGGWGIELEADDGSTEIVAAEFLSGRSRKPMYVSVGWDAELADSVRTVKALCTKHRSPEPIYLADRLSREAVHRDNS